jgi:tetratricopeptide (TPR) repeat protein
MRKSLKDNLVCGLVGLLVVSTGCEAPRRLSLEEQVSRNITDTPKLHETNPSISADGKKIVFEVDDKGNKEIFLKNLETEQLMNISNSPANDYQPSISADGKKVIFLSDRTGSSEIHMVSLADIFYARGLQSKASGDIENAISYFEQATSTDSLHIPSYQELGGLYDEREDYDKAIKEFDTIANLYTSELIEFLKNKDSSAIQIKAELEILVKNNITAYNNLALVYIHKGGKKAAADVYYSLGTLFDKIGWNNFAIAEFQKGLDVDPAPSFDVYSLLGKLYREANNYKESAEMLEKALQIDSNSAPTHNNLGMVYARLASQEDAKKVGLTHVKQTLEENAKKEYEKAIEISPNFTDAHQNLAVYFYERGEYRNALREWEIIYKINPEYPDLKKNLDLVKRKLQISD